MDRNRIIVEVPVILAELSAEVILDNSLQLTYGASLVKNVKSQLQINECTLIGNNDTVCIKGLIKKDIAYFTHFPSNVIGAIGDIHSCKIELPFISYKRITYNRFQPDEIKKTRTYANTYLSDLKIPTYPLKHNEPPPIEYIGQIMEEQYNSPISCEVTSSRLYDHNRINKTEIPNIRTPLGIKEVIEVENKSVITMDINVLQNRKIYLPSYIV